MTGNGIGNYAKIAQLVERHLAKVEVAGSNPVFRSKTLLAAFFCFKSILMYCPGGGMVDTLDLKSNEQQCSCGFKSRSGYWTGKVIEPRCFSCF